MSIDFDLSESQRRLKARAREFAREVLRGPAERADRIRDPQEAFAAMRPVYRQAAAAGFTSMYLPREYGGGGASNVDFLIAVEELCAVDPGFATILLINGLALMPIYWCGTEEQQETWLPRAADDRTGDFLAGWVVSERGGTANFDHPSPRAGIQTLATPRPRKDDVVIDGEKHWAGNAGGWDLRGADINVCVVRTGRDEGGKSALSAVIVERGTPGITYEAIDKVAHRTCQNVTMTLRDVRVPRSNMFAVGDGDLLINRDFTWSSPIASIAAVGAARGAYEFALQWARTFTGGGSVPIIEHQAAGHLLSDIAGRIEAGRYIAWKSAHYLDRHPGEGHAIGAMSKVFCGEQMQQVVIDCMRLVGVNALDVRFPLAKLYREASVFSLYDAGNLAMQRRRAWGVIADPRFDADTFVDTSGLPFTRSMEGKGL